MARMDDDALWDLAGAEDWDETEWPKLTADARTLYGQLVRTEISAPLEIDVVISLSDDWYADHLCNATDGGMASYGLTGTSQIGAYEGRPCVTVNAKGSDARGAAQYCSYLGECVDVFQDVLSVHVTAVNGQPLAS